MKQDNQSGQIKKNNEDEEEEKSNELDKESQNYYKQMRMKNQSRPSQYLLLQSPFKHPVSTEENHFQYFDINQPNLPIQQTNSELKRNQFQDAQSQIENQEEINLDNLRFVFSKKDRADDEMESDEIQSRRGLFRYNNILEDLEIVDRNDPKLKKIMIKGLDSVPFQNYLEYIDLTNINAEKLQKKHKLKDISFMYLLQVSYQNIKWMIRRTLEQVILFEKEYIKFLKQLDFEDIDKGYISLDVTIEKEVRENKPNQILKNITDNIKLMANQFNFEQVGVDPLIENRNLQEITSKQYRLIDEFKTTLRAFLEFSDIFEEGKQKHKEVFVYKRAGGRYKQSLCQKLNCKNLFGCYDKRYFLISQEGVMYTRGLIHPESTLREVILFDYNFQVEYGKKQTGQEFGNYFQNFFNQISKPFMIDDYLYS